MSSILRKAGPALLAALALHPGQPLAAGGCCSRNRTRTVGVWVACGVGGAVVGRELGTLLGLQLRTLRHPVPAGPGHPGAGWNGSLPVGGEGTDLARLAVPAGLQADGADGADAAVPLQEEVARTLAVYRSGACSQRVSGRRLPPGVPVAKAPFRHGGEEQLEARLLAAQADPLAWVQLVVRADDLAATVDLGVCLGLEQFQEATGTGAATRRRLLQERLRDAAALEADLKAEMEFGLKLLRHYEGLHQAARKDAPDRGYHLSRVLWRLDLAFKHMVAAHKRLTGAAAPLLALLEGSGAGR